MLREAKRREWRIELREAALERKGLKDRIFQLEARLEQQTEIYKAKIEKLEADLDNHRRTIEALLIEKRVHLAGLEAILVECQKVAVKDAALFRIESIALNAVNK